MQYKNIILEIEGGIATLTIDRPSTLNNLSRETLAELESALTDLDDGRPGAIIITGAGEKAFIAGGDVAEMKGMTPKDAEEYSELGHRVMDLIECHAKPTIAAINGYALGGGCELSLACDIRIASENAKIGLPELNLGIIPGWGGTQRVARLVGKAVAKQMILTGEMIEAKEAERIGLVSRVVPQSELASAARELAGDLAARPAVALALAKQAIHEVSESGQHAGMKAEAELFSRCFVTEDQKEGIDAFLSKRKPVFQGK